MMSCSWLDIDSCRWTFGDGATSTQHYPSHLYTSTGCHDVSIRVDSPHGSRGMMVEGCVAVYADTMAVGSTVLPETGPSESISVP